MNGNLSATPPPPPVPPKRGNGCIKACGCGCLVLVILTGLAIFGIVRLVQHQLRDVTALIESEGYTPVISQAIDITSTVADPTVFVGQTVRIRAGSLRGIAVVGQTVELDGSFEGNVRVYAQALTIAEGAVLKKDLHAVTQTSDIRGQILGQVTGAPEGEVEATPDSPAAE